MLATNVQRYVDPHMDGEDSPVINETLSVIDEHITDLSTPRHSLAVRDHRQKPSAGSGTDSGSDYSNRFGHRVSYINGHETDEEEENQPTEEQVRKWNSATTAKHLRNLGLEDRHCQIFEEQEITGDVLLDMDQNFVFMKDFDFGVMGRRLKTWHKIKAFQEEVKGLRQSPQASTPGPSGAAGSPDEWTRSRAGSGSFLPRIPSLPGDDELYQQSRGSGSSSGNRRRVNSGGLGDRSSGSTANSSPRLPSAASLRQVNRSRRHSSIDTTASSPPLKGLHRAKSSLDRSWSMAVGAGPPAALNRSGSGVYRADTNESDSAISVSDKYDDLDRGYFSQTEADSRGSRRTLKKRSLTRGASLGNSSKSGHTAADSVSSSGGKRHSRIESADSIREAADHLSAAAKSSHHPAPPKGRFRSFSTRRSGGQSSQSSAEDKPNAGFFSSRAASFSKPEKTASNGSQPANNTGEKFRRTMGLRVMSDFVGKGGGGGGGGGDSSGSTASPVEKHGPFSARTGSTTPSAKSSERHSTDNSAKTIEDGTSLVRAKTSSMKGGLKSKKETSAYIQGLEKKPPQQQMIGCDYYGWMKKRSSHMVATWKPRFFVLRGRRLSYYYSLSDTEEKGLIDITAHRVLRADNDPMITLHATITGATVSPTSTAEPRDLDSPIDTTSLPFQPTKRESSSPFFFKLAPPKTGTSRTVQFTKPTVHYFQVDDIKQGRAWMAALVKATIERDLSQPVESTNRQNTVSLRQARNMNQRPPGLVDIAPIHEVEYANSAEDEGDYYDNGQSPKENP